MKNENLPKISAAKPKTSMSGLCIILAIIAFVLGAMVQGKYDLRQTFLNGLVSQKSMQRQKLAKIFNLHQKAPAWSRFQIQKETDHPTYTEQLVEFTGQDDNDHLSAYLLIPKSSATSKKLPAALCIHGHHSTKENVAGITPFSLTISTTVTPWSKRAMSYWFLKFATLRIYGSLRTRWG